MKIAPEFECGELDFIDDPPAFEPPIALEDFVIDLPLGGSSIQLRDYQIEAIEKIEAGWKDFSRQLLVMAGGCGKTEIFSQLAKRTVDRGGRVLILVHSEELLDQACFKLLRSTGIEADVEKGDQHASLSVEVVVAMIQTLSKDARLLGFPDDHFALVIVDEAHRSLSNSHRKIAYYFHFGEASLDESWVMPGIGVKFKYHARLCGFTATPSRGDKKNLGELYQSVPMSYGLLEACRDGYLVRPMIKNMPLKIDLTAHSENECVMRGNDYDPEFIAERITPLLAEIARNMKESAGRLKTICFLPSVATARMLAEELCKIGMDATFVSGACEDRTAKMARFRKAGPGSVLCNALLVVEGVDIPDVSCVCILRPTKIWSFYVQASVRGTRTLPGTIDGLLTRQGRLAAIARSAKPSFLLLDFFWLSDKHDLIRTVDLFDSKPEVRQKMAEIGANDGGTSDLLNIELAATRDLIKSLEKAAKEHQAKAARVVDPLVWAVSLGDDALATWEPQTAWDELPATPSQLRWIHDQHIDATHVKYRGHAQKIIARLMSRYEHKLATALQLNFLRKLGVDDPDIALMTMKEATSATDAILAEKEGRRLAASRPCPE